MTCFLKRSLTRISPCHPTSACTLGGHLVLAFALLLPVPALELPVCLPHSFPASLKLPGVWGGTGVTADVCPRRSPTRL